MSRGSLLRMLEFAKRTLRAVDVRAELGGQPPRDPCMLWAPLGDDTLRLVVVFDTPPSDRDGVQRKIEELAGTFTHTAERALEELPAEQTPPHLPHRRLDDALQALKTHLRSLRVLVLDVQSPVLWGATERDADNDVDELEELGRALAKAEHRGIGIAELLEMPAEALPQQLSRAGLLSAQVWALERAIEPLRHEPEARTRLLSARAVFEVRAAHRATPGERCVLRGPGLGLLARPFANIYRLLAVFDGPFSELHVESAMLQAIPTIEQLLFALPPVDPPPRAGRVLRLPTRS